MSMEIPIFERQSMNGASSSVDYLSEPFDVSEYSTMNAELQVFGLIGTSPTIVVSLETAADLLTPDDRWTAVTTFTTVNNAPTIQVNLIPEGSMSQFVRGKVTINGSDHSVTLSLKGMARESS